MEQIITIIINSIISIIMNIQVCKLLRYNITIINTINSVLSLLLGSVLSNQSKVNEERTANNRTWR